MTPSVKKGQIFGIIGLNGSGKSTLFNLISGVLKKDGGHLFFEGGPIDDLPPHKIHELELGRGFQTPPRKSLRYLINTNTGDIIAIVDSYSLGAGRTGAGGAVGTKYLSRADSSSAGIVGAGRQARVRLRYLLEVSNI